MKRILEFLSENRWRIRRTALWLLVGVLPYVLLATCSRQAEKRFESQAPEALESESDTFIKQSEILESIAEESGSRIFGVWDEALNVPTFISGPISSRRLGVGIRITGDTFRIDFLDRYKNLFGIRDPASELRLLEEHQPDSTGMLHYTFQQVYGGIDVFGRTISFHFKPDHSLAAINSNFTPGISDVTTQPSIPGDSAIQVIAPNAGYLFLPAYEPRLCIYSDHQKHEQIPPALAWYIEDNEAWGYFVNAHTGAKLDSIPLVFAACDRTIYNTGLSGNPIRKEKDNPTGHAMTDNAHKVLGMIYDYFSEEHKLDSYDDTGSGIKAIINYRRAGKACDNAWWVRGELVFKFCEPFFAKDIAAHEFTHAVTDFAIRESLNYKGESGAIKESFGDIFAVLIDDANWDFAEETGRIQRSISDPAKYNLPEHTDEWRCSDQRVHENSSIINKTFFYIANSIGRKKAGKIFFRVLKGDYLTNTSSFSNLRFACIRATQDLYGESSNEANVVVDAFDKTGIHGAWRADCQHL